MDPGGEQRDVRLEDYDAAYMPGGHGPMSDLAWDADVGRLLTKQLTSGHPLFIVCHAPAFASTAERLPASTGAR